MECLGIDIGSCTIKIVHLDDGDIAGWEVVDATSHPSDTAATLLLKYGNLPCMATGYGRHLLEINDTPSITEIKACAKGVARLRQDANVIIDIGGQDLKVITLDANRKVAKFEMNDRCAAGTGKFLEIMAQRLDYPLDEFGSAALTGNTTVTISSLCTVFAESEVVGLLNRSEPRTNIARAIHKSVTGKIGGMFKRIAPSDASVVLVGGGARNPALVQLLRQELGTPVSVPPHPQIVAALGAALLCAESLR